MSNDSEDLLLPGAQEMPGLDFNGLPPVLSETDQGFYNKHPRIVKLVGAVALVAMGGGIGYALTNNTETVSGHGAPAAASSAAPSATPSETSPAPNTPTSLPTTSNPSTPEATVPNKPSVPEIKLAGATGEMTKLPGYGLGVSAEQAAQLKASTVLLMSRSDESQPWTFECTTPKVGTATFRTALHCLTDDPTTSEPWKANRDITGSLKKEYAIQTIGGADISRVTQVVGSAEADEAVLAVAAPTKQLAAVPAFDLDTTQPATTLVPGQTVVAYMDTQIGYDEHLQPNRQLVGEYLGTATDPTSQVGRKYNIIGIVSPENPADDTADNDLCNAGSSGSMMIATTKDGKAVDVGVHSQTVRVEPFYKDSQLIGVYAYDHNGNLVTPESARQFAAQLSASLPNKKVLSKFKEFCMFTDGSIANRGEMLAMLHGGTKTSSAADIHLSNIDATEERKIN